MLLLPRYASSHPTSSRLQAHRVQLLLHKLSRRAQNRRTLVDRLPRGALPLRAPLLQQHRASSLLLSHRTAVAALMIWSKRLSKTGTTLPSMTVRTPRKSAPSPQQPSLPQWNTAKPQRRTDRNTHNEQVSRRESSTRTSHRMDRRPLEEGPRRRKDGAPLLGLPLAQQRHPPARCPL